MTDVRLLLVTLLVVSSGQRTGTQKRANLDGSYSVAGNSLAKATVTRLFLFLSLSLSPLG